MQRVSSVMTGGLKRGGATLAILALLGAPVAGQAADCEALGGEALPGGSRVANAAIEGELCVVDVTFEDSGLAFRAWLPQTAWNGKLAYVGGGGFDGLIKPVPDFVSTSIKKNRYAVVTTNGGYTAANPAHYFRAEFAADSQALADYTFQSEHRSLPAARELVRRYYGSAPSHSYFEGCSMGGHDALLLAQRYPRDFDGIVARAPAGNVMGLFAKFHQIASQVAREGAALGPARQQALAAAVRMRCDELDGLADGVVANREVCRFDPSSLACDVAGADPGVCLEPAQVKTLGTIAAPLGDPDGILYHPGFDLSGAASLAWGEYPWPQAALGGQSLQKLFSDGFIRSFVTRDPDYDTANWRAADWRASLDLVGAMFQATDPDISEFVDRGGKLVIWNGLSDTSVSARDSVRYYRAVKAALGNGADKAVTLYLAPGVGHCRGGEGPGRADLMTALADWVERGQVPGASLVTRGDGGDARPLCPYPGYPHYRGSGDPGDPENFECRVPHHSEREE